MNGPAERTPFWDYQDAAMFVSFATPLFVVSLLLMKLSAPWGARLGLSKPMLALLFQFVWYALAFFALAAWFRLRYRRRFWRSLGFFRPLTHWNAFFTGIALAFLTGALGALLRTPPIELPLGEMVTGRASLVFLGVLVCVLAPLCEELAFRGFLMPLFARSLGAAAAIALTALLFSLLHGPEYDWSWRHVLLIFSAGACFGWIRNRTGSTFPAALAHAGFNLTSFAGFLAQGGAIPKQW